MTTKPRAVFRLPTAAVLLPVLILLCVIPLATAGGGWAALFVLPVVVLAYIVYTRTVADSHGVLVHTLLGRRRMAWSEMAGLEFHGSRWAIAVGLDGRRLRLPMVRPRDLRRLAAVSGGTLTLDPTPSPPVSAELDETPPVAAPATIAEPPDQERAARD